MLAERNWSGERLVDERHEGLRLDCERGRLGTSVKDRSYIRKIKHTIEHVAFVVGGLFDICGPVVTSDARSDAAVYPLFSIVV